MKIRWSILLAALFASNASACVWDSDTMLLERIRNHDLATAILHNDPVAPDAKKLQKRIKELEADRHENDPDWWNNLAGAYVRLGQPEAAVKLLTPVAEKFPNNYGIHANLGTVLHLLGKYSEAEKEIARDLEINPDAHFGLEKYHLALLQYLARDTKYQSRHVYVDEFTPSLLRSMYRHTAFANQIKTETERERAIAEAEDDFRSFASNITDPFFEKQYGERLMNVAALDSLPAYRAKWDLMSDTNLEQGIIYMAQMNPREPACYTMLGVAAWRKRDYHLAKAAFEKAVALGSPQTELLKSKIAELTERIKNSPVLSPEAWIGIAVAVPVLYYIYGKIRDRKKRRTLA